MADQLTESNAAISRRLQERFETYFIGLIFTVLALSIQTGAFGAAPAADALELLAWLLLLISGLAGLSRAEWLPVLYTGAAERDKRLSIAAQIQEHGNPVIIDETTGNRESAAAYLAAVHHAAKGIESGLQPLERRQQAKYRVMKWCFVAGVVALIAARAFVPAAGLIARFR
jgi:hypothetical protein